MNITARTASEALPELCQAVLEGEVRPSRNGATRERLFTTITLTEPWRREILTPGRKANVVAQIAETLWVLAGRNDVEWLSAYLPRAKDFSDDGKTWRAGYGPRIRAAAANSLSDDDYVDQLAEVVGRLQTNLDDRRAVINLWNPAVDNNDGKDVPCNNWLHFLVRDNKLHLHIATRSNDLMWGWSGINAFEWSALQELVASMLDVQIGEMHFAISSLHLYEPYWKKAARLEATDESALRDSPEAEVAGIRSLDTDLAEIFRAEALMREGKPFDLTAIDDPMLCSWARVLAWHWTKDEYWIEILKGTRLYAATREMPKPVSEFAEWAAKLHAEKHALYGDSWKKRGEQVSIQANIARKIDRLGKAGAGDTELDTTTDLLVYLVKYGLWLAPGVDTDGDDHVSEVTDVLRSLARRDVPKGGPEALQQYLEREFESLLDTGLVRDRRGVVNQMTAASYGLALYRYNEQKAAEKDRDAALTRYCYRCQAAEANHAPGGSQYGQCNFTYEAPVALGQTHADRNARRSWNPES